MMPLRAFLLALAMLASHGWVRVTPRVCMSPCDVTVTVHSERPAGAYVVILEGDSYSSASAREHPRATVEFPTFRSLPAGQYEVDTKVYGEDGKLQWADRQGIEVGGAQPR